MSHTQNTYLYIIFHGVKSKHDSKKMCTYIISSYDDITHIYLMLSAICLQQYALGHVPLS